MRHGEIERKEEIKPIKEVIGLMIILIGLLIGFLMNNILVFMIALLLGALIVAIPRNIIRKIKNILEEHVCVAAEDIFKR